MADRHSDRGGGAASVLNMADSDYPGPRDPTPTGSSPHRNFLKERVGVERERGWGSRERERENILLKQSKGEMQSILKEEVNEVKIWREGG